MGHGLLKPIVSPSCARAKVGGQSALRLLAYKLRRRWGRTRRREGKHSETRRAEPSNWNDGARIAQASLPPRARERRGTCRAAGSVCGFVECVCTQACERAIEREKGDMARDSRGRNHGAGTTGRGSRKPTSILTRVRERSRVNADPEARGRERGGGGSSQAWQEGALQAYALHA